MTSPLLGFGFALVAFSLPVSAQAQDSYRYLSAGELQKMLKPDPSGLYSQVGLAHTPTFLSLVTTRDRSGQAELHKDWADYIVIQEGAATMTLGGTVEGGQEVSKGEVRGTGIVGGKNFPLRPGDYIYIPANVPHRMTLTPGATIKYIVFKTR